MGKANKNRKKARAAANPYTAPSKPANALPTPPIDDTTDISPPNGDELDVIDLLTTIDTLNYLLERPALLKSPAHKQTRALIHKLYGVVSIGGANPGGLNPETELIAALRNRDHPRARALLSSIKTPKLGALQRWVRECDAANVVDPEDPEGYEQQQIETWKTLEAIIRTTMDTEGQARPTQSTLVRFKPWEGTDKQESERIQVYNQVQEGSLVSPEEASHVRTSFRVLKTIPGPERKPPNLHPAIIWASSSGAIPLPLSTGPVISQEIPNIPNAIILNNVLSPTTCRLIIGSADTLGFTPDQAAGGSATSLASILAHNFYWMADEAFNDALFERVKPHLPPTINGLPIKTINRRYRTYRYVPGAVYRPHVDGAWPPSGIDPKDGSYVYDSSPPSNPQYSRFTFLVYLNDEFEGGETTFFVPREGGEGLEARPVRPLQGSVVVFPHGDAKGSLVHEGTGVTKGAKFIIRTDVVYEVPKTGRAAAPAL